MAKLGQLDRGPGLDLRQDLFDTRIAGFGPGLTEQSLEAPEPSQRNPPHQQPDPNPIQLVEQLISTLARLGPSGKRVRRLLNREQAVKRGDAGRSGGALSPLRASAKAEPLTPSRCLRLIDCALGPERGSIFMLSV